VKAQVVEALLGDLGPKVLMLALISLVETAASGGLSFDSIIIKGFRFKDRIMDYESSFRRTVVVRLFICSFVSTSPWCVAKYRGRGYGWLVQVY
jgi:hypothetical protein